MGRALGVDLGTKRIGLATCDARRTLASPLKVVPRSGDHQADARQLVAIAEEEEAAIIVVGMPTTLQGASGLAAESVEADVALIRSLTDIPVATYDERMTTASAAKSLQAQGISSRTRRESIDKYAAAVMLQGWLDSQPKIALEETR